MVTRLGSSPLPVCVCGHSALEHEGWDERGRRTEWCVCGCSMFELDGDR